jgi:hypothetical protein
LVNTKKHSAVSVNLPSAPPKPSLIEKIRKEDVVQATVGAVAVYASVKAINTLSTIAINYAPKR